MGRTAAQNRFAQIPAAEIQRSAFNRSSGYKTTFDAGYLIPMFLDEIIPGDTVSMKMSLFARLATQLHPVMDNMYIDTQWFFVPTRLVWDNFEKFNGAQDNPGDSTDFLIPTMTSTGGGHANGSLSDYMGIPTDVGGLEHSSLFHRAYALIFNEWYRDQNLVDSIPIDKGNGPDAPADYTLMRRQKRHDYFSSSLPFPQKGDAVNISIGDSAPVTLDVQTQPVEAFTAPVFTYGGLTSTLTAKDAGAGTSVELDLSTGFQDGVIEWYQPGLRTQFDGITGVADLTQAESATINQLRTAFQLQRLLERDARGGTRYTEIVKSHFGVTSPDARLQRPEYLGGGTTPINVNPIAQSMSLAGTGNLGDLGAFATASANQKGFTASFTEHGMLIGIVSARADLNYQQGLPRMFSRQTRFDHYFPALAHLGEQSVLQKEIFASGVPSEDDLVFGYQERFAEMRYRPSQITGQFRSNFAQSLDTWHLAQDFDEAPVLNEDFIIEDPPFDRIIAVQDYPHFLFDAFFQYNHVRPMPTYSVPGMIDHF